MEKPMLSTQRQGRLNTNLQELLVWHTYHVVQLPRWRHPLIGYVLSALLVGLGFFLGLIEARLLVPMTFPGVPLTLTVLIVALLWGAGPAVLALLLGLFVLDYLYVPPFGVLGGYEVSGALQLLTFTLAGIVTALLASQLESARLRAVVAEGQAITRANQVEATFEAMTDGVVVYNHQGHVLQTNAATDHLFGLACLPSTDKARSRQELLLRAAERDERGALLPAERRPLSRLFKGRALSGANAVDVLVHTPDGREVLLNTSGAPIRDEKGNIERAVLIFRDVTERRRLEQHTADSLSALLAIEEVLALERVRLQQEWAEARANELAMREAKRGMEESLSLICHELLTPLTVIKGSIQLSEQKVKRFVHSAETPAGAARQLAPIQALLERAKSQVSFQDQLIHDLLDVSRIQANILQLSMQLCNLAWILQEAIEDQRQVAPSRAIRLELPAEGPVPVQADSCRIAQVVTNYLTNALKYSAPDRPVEVHLQVEGRIARVTVRDQGPGLAPAEQERIWERFYRVQGIEVQSESEASSGGLGIGLYLCRTIIEQHHGQVGVQSTPSKGSNFWFTLPLTGQEETEEEAVLG
jgi:signal transduction histidine kinase